MRIGVFLLMVGMAITQCTSNVFAEEKATKLVVETDLSARICIMPARLPMCGSLNSTYQ